MDVIYLAIPRPVRDIVDSAWERLENKRDTGDYRFHSWEWRFVAVTAERLLLAGLAATVLRQLPAPKWAIPAGTALLSLPAATLLLGGELAYWGFTSLSFAPQQLVKGVAAIGASWWLFENYDHFHFHPKGGWDQISLRPESDLAKRQAATPLTQGTAPKCLWRVGLFEPALSWVNSKLIPQ